MIGFAYFSIISLLYRLLYDIWDVNLIKYSDRCDINIVRDFQIARKRTVGNVTHIHYLPCVMWIYTKYILSSAELGLQ